MMLSAQGGRASMRCIVGENGSNGLRWKGEEGEGEEEGINLERGGK